MANITAYDAISSGDAVLASVVSGNFTKIAAAVNSNALNQENYGQSAVLSQHISTDAILSQHLSDSAVVSQKISDSAVAHNNLNFQSSAGGVRIVQIGEASDSMPAGGVMFARITETMSQSDTLTVPFTHVFSDAIDGNPSFTATPVMAGVPMVQYDNATDQGPSAVIISAIDSDSVVMIYSWSATQANTDFTVHVGVEGPIA